MITVIADSGGTKTDFCIVENGEKEIITRPSYRVDSLVGEKLEAEIQFWQKTLKDASSVQLQFFGAGCLSKEGNEKQCELLEQLGFIDFTVQSDLHLAGKSAYGEKSGFVAIMGTGSVLFYWDGKEVQDVYGGKGYLKGDEGSGFYFGKLILLKYLEGSLSAEQSQLVEKVLQPSIRKKESLQNKQLILDLSKAISRSMINFDRIHQENVELLFESYSSQNKVDKMTVVGGYGFHQKDIVQEVFLKFNVKSRQFVEKPLRTFIECTIFPID